MIVIFRSTFLHQASSRLQLLLVPRSPLHSSFSYLRGVASTTCARSLTRGSDLSANSVDHAPRTYCSRQRLLSIHSKRNKNGTELVSSSNKAANAAAAACNHPPPLFQDLEDLNPHVKLSLAQAGLERMTEIQAKTWEAAFVRQKDVIGRARTGTGKTLAFLLPAVERLVRDLQQQQKQSDAMVRMLVLSPTRELARQIYQEAITLTSTMTTMQAHPLKPPEKEHVGDTSKETRGDNIVLSCQIIYGGIPKRHDLDRFQERIPTILVATIGRLVDHMASTYVRDKPFRDYLKHVNILVLDEMDKLLEVGGFLEDIQEILAFLPHDHQTMLFSATIPARAREMIDLCVKKDHVFIDCIDDDDPATHTNASIHQTYAILPTSRMISGAVELVEKLMKQPKHKILVFFPTTSQVAYFAGLFNRVLGRHILEIHSEKTQEERSFASDRFRMAHQAVMFTSDVSARGVDYPNVSHVVQFGMAKNREAYIHRLGRTGRAGKRGKGILVLLEAEKDYLEQDLSGLAIRPNSTLQRLLDRPASSRIKSDLLHMTHDVRKNKNNGLLSDDLLVLQRDAESVYRGLIGYYNSRLGRASKEAIVDLANAFADQAGLPELPQISEKLAKECGLLSHPRINVRKTQWTVGNHFDVGGGDGQTPQLEGSGEWNQEMDWRGIDNGFSRKK